MPGVDVVKGDLEDADLIEKEAKAADVVFHLASTRHEPSSRAIIKGLSDPSRKPGYWIQIGGAAMFAGPQVKAGTYGEGGGKTYDDVQDIEEIKNIIRSSPARVIDNLILAQDKVKTALVPGPIIYGKGRGAVNTRTIQGPAIAEYTLKHGEAFQVGKGENVWSTVHVADIGKLFALLLGAAAKGQDEVFKDGIFFAESGKIVSVPPLVLIFADKQSFSEYAQLISKAARDQGLIKSDNIKSLTAEEVDQVLPHGAVVLGTDAILSASRAKQALGWSPSEMSLAEDVPRMVKDEAERS